MTKTTDVAMAAAAKARLLYVLSPAKTLDMSSTSVTANSTPRLLADAHVLVTELRKLTTAKVKALLGVSDALAKLNYDRFQSFEFLSNDQSKPVPNSNEIHKQAVLAFNGPAYQGLAAQELTTNDLEFAQKHLRILCGLYGALRPLDLIQAYRLEMGQKFATSRGKDLYAFWGDRIAQEINHTLSTGSSDGTNSATEKKVLVNVASQEYFKSVVGSALSEDITVVECVFKDDGKIKSVYAKRARGLMCRYLIINRVDSLEKLKQFDLEGYAFSVKESDDHTLVFNRTAAKQKEVLKQIQAKAKKAKEEKAAESVDDDQVDEKETKGAVIKKERVKTQKPNKVVEKLMTKETPVKEGGEEMDGLRRSKRRRV